jgi:hypothetical protein
MTLPIDQSGGTCCHHRSGDVFSDIVAIPPVVRFLPRFGDLRAALSLGRDRLGYVGVDQNNQPLQL